MHNILLHIISMYKLAETKFRKLLHKRGYANIKHFARMAGLNRNTTHAYLRGQPVFSRQFLNITEALGCDPLQALENREVTASLPDIPSAIMHIADELAQHKNGMCCFLFGSRTTDNFAKNSDWDLSIASARLSISTKDYLALKVKTEDLSESHQRKHACVEPVSRPMGDSA
jgi:hypothetical protein